MTIVHELDRLASAQRLATSIGSWPGVISAVGSAGPHGGILSVVVDTADIGLVDQVRRRVLEVDRSARQTHLSPPVPIPSRAAQQVAASDVS